MTANSRYCPRCAAALPGTAPTTCAACSYAIFVNPRPTGSVIVVREVGDGERGSRPGTQFLAIRRAIEPRKGLWELPGGFCDGWEHPSDAAVREAREEVGVDVRLEDFVGMYLGSYEFQRELLPVLDCFWLATIMDGNIGLNPTEASEYRWCSLADAPQMAFETMDRALADAMRCLRAGTGGN